MVGFCGRGDAVIKSRGCFSLPAANPKATKKSHAAHNFREKDDMLRISLITIASALLSMPAIAKECWAVTNVVGQASESNGNYKFLQSAPGKAAVICFDQTSGTNSIVDTPYKRVGESMLVRTETDAGHEVIESIAIDRRRGKMLFAMTARREMTPDDNFFATAYIGDATLIASSDSNR